jgi:pimeloyl-ACP methyl ester carboxylesterase
MKDRCCAFLGTPVYGLLQLFESKRQFRWKANPLTALTLFLLIGSGTALSQLPPFQFLQKPGPYHVGLKVVNQYDPSRKFPAAPDRPEAPAGQGSRPLQTLIWYPALQSSSKPMTVGGYVVLADREIHFDTPGQEHNKWRRRLKSSFDVSLWAVRDAKPVEVRDPVVIYAPSDSSLAWENADLCEYLASHGYVVLANPSMGASTRDMTDDLAGIDTQALDISFLISYAATLPDADPSKVAVVSFSWGGISSLFAAARDTRIQVLAEMDGSMRYYPGLVASAGDVHPEQLKLPLLFFTANDMNYVEDLDAYHGPPNERIGRSVLNEWTHGDVTTVNMVGMSHAEFCSMFQRLQNADTFAGDQVADYGREDANTSYSWVALYMLQFVNAYVKHDAAAKKFLGRTTAENGVPKHIMEIKFSPKSFAEIMRSAARTGEESAWEAFQSFAADPMHRYMTGEEKMINRLGYAFLQEKDPSSAVVLFKLNTKAYPDSANAWDSLGDGYEATNDIQDARMAYARSVELNPGNEHAKSELVKLRK